MASAELDWGYGSSLHQSVHHQAIVLHLYLHCMLLPSHFYLHLLFLDTLGFHLLEYAWSLFLRRFVGRHHVCEHVW